MPPRMTLSEARSILKAHAHKHNDEFLIDALLVEVAGKVLGHIHTGLIEEDLAEAIQVVWEHYTSRINRVIKKFPQLPCLNIQGLDHLVIDPEGHIVLHYRVVTPEVVL